MIPKRGAAARARVLSDFEHGKAGAENAECIPRRERRCGDERLVLLLTRWRDAEARADVAFEVMTRRGLGAGREESRFQRAEERADNAWVRVRDYAQKAVGK